MKNRVSPYFSDGPRGPLPVSDPATRAKQFLSYCETKKSDVNLGEIDEDGT